MAYQDVDVTTKSGPTQMKQVTGSALPDDKTGMDVVQNDPILLTKTITENSQLKFVAYNLDDTASDSDSTWRLKRVLTQGNTVTETWADDKRFSQSITDPASSFPPVVLSNPASLLGDGSTKYINLGDNYTFGPAISFSWSLWMKADNFSANRRFISKTSQDANVYGYNLGHDSTGKLWAQMRAPSSLRAHTYSTTLTAGVWYHICFTYAGGSNISGMKAYINGSVEPAPSSGSLNAWTVTDPLTFFNRGNTFYFSGNLNQISVWNKELSSSEVTEVYNSGSPGDLTGHSAYANLLSWWFLNTDANFPTEVDQEGSINGTLVNFVAGDYDTGDVP